MLVIQAEVFMDICQDFPNSKLALQNQAVKRSQMFEHYKMIKIIKYMKTILNN